MATLVESVPRHLAIIPDGNRRWAKEQGLWKTAGHKRSGTYENLRILLHEAKRLGVKYFSLWGFSTENWKREKKEIDEIFALIEKGLSKFLKEAHTEKVGFLHVGRKDRIPESLAVLLENLERETAQYRDLCVVLCIDYGGRDEIVRAAEKVKESGKSFGDCLDTFGIPDVDLIIRTGGENRTSGFMPFQSVYAEWIFSETFFPDFSPEHLRKAVEEFGRRKRNFGV